MLTQHLLIKLFLHSVIIIIIIINGSLLSTYKNKNNRHYNV